MSKKYDKNAQHDQLSADVKIEIDETKPIKADHELTYDPALEKPDPNKYEKGKYYTYVGAGESSPYVINLMGKQKFVRGEKTKVTDPELLQKLPGIKTFVEGKVDPEVLHKIDQEGREHAERQRVQDQIINAKYTKKHSGE